MNIQTFAFRINTTNRLAIVFFLLVTMAFIVPGTARADNLVQNGGFETGDFSGWQVSGDVQGAQVVTGGSNTGCCYARFSPVDGYAYISQYIATPHSPGSSQLYDLIFDWHIIDLPPWDFQVFWNGQLVNDVQNTGPNQWTKVELDGLTATQQETQLTFGFKVGDSQSYFGLDDISLTSQQTPEPGTLMLLGSGVLGLGGLLRRRLLG